MRTFKQLGVAVTAGVGMVGLIAAAVVLIVARPTHAAAIDPNAWYEIVSRHSDKAIDVCNHTLDDGACVQQYSPTGNQNQQFRFLDSGGGYHRIQVRHSGKVLDVAAASTDNGANIVAWTDTGSTNQQFQVADTSDGYVEIIARHSGKCIDVPGFSTENSTRLQQYSCWGGANQQWRLTEVDGGGQQGSRQMEDLDRGVVAVRSSSTDVLVSWRLLGLDPVGIGFNVYRSASGGSWARLNGSTLTGGTNYTDSSANLSQANSYRVTAVVNGQEQSPSDAFTLSANHAEEPVVRVPIRDGAAIKFTWVGDLDGDGAYDYVVDRHSTEQAIEAYNSDGQFLWRVDMGPNSRDRDGIEIGSSAIDAGHNDGVTVFDFDRDGRSEVAVRIANGVTFGDGQTWTHSNNDRQFIAILDGRTGALRNWAAVPTTYIADGPMAARFMACYLDGETPSLVAYMKNRKDDGHFNLLMGAWRFTGSSLRQQWIWDRGYQNHPDGHNSRCIDVDGNGTDEVVEIGFVLNGDGTLKYSMGPRGIVHGDRFHIADMDPSRPGLEGYGVQQRNSSGLHEYYYDAATGEIIWEHYGSGADVGRGMVGDIDPRFPGMESWAFDGLYNAPANRLTEPDTSLRPWPHMGLWWDGDLGMELYNGGKIEQWDWNNPTPTASAPRLESTWRYGAVTGARGEPSLIADIHGDWREEVVMPNGSFNELIVFTTDQPTSHRLYTLAHNPAYRADMTVKGYMQSHHVDYFLGWGMSTPPRPDITY